MKIILPWTRTILRGDGMEFYGYEKISLDEILQKLGEDGKKKDLKFMFARQIAPYNIETILALLYIKKIVDTKEIKDEFGDKVKDVILDILQWGDDKFSWSNIEKRIFVRPQILYSKSQYPIAAVKSMRELREYNGRIGDIYLDVNKISKMIEETQLKYMKVSLNYLINEGKVKDGRVNILDFWGLTTLYYIVEVSRYIFGIDNYKIDKFKDKIKLVNRDEFDISGYELTFKYKEKELRFRIYDGSHIYKEENEKYKKEEKMNSYIALALYSGSGYILLEEDPGKSSVDQKIREFYRKAKEGTGYDILLLEVDEKKLIERKIISEDSYVEFIGKDEIKKIIDAIRNIYGI
ncbi:MAG: hypothetical protein RXQ68_01260 [Candidatus Nanopusillus sp.]